MRTNTQINIGSSVSHTSTYGMQGAHGKVVAEAGVRYGRRYVWVNYTTPKTGKTFNSAFWDQVLRPSLKNPTVLPGTIPHSLQ